MNSRDPWPDVAPSTRRVMKANGNKDTAPELAVRRLIHRLGFRFRLHRKDLPGRPDIVFPSRRKVVFVHGCFWHHHACQAGRLPKTRTGYWEAKLTRNKERDVKNRVALDSAGWESVTVWECELTDYETLSNRLLRFLRNVES